MTSALARALPRVRQRNNISRFSCFGFTKYISLDNNIILITLILILTLNQHTFNPNLNKLTLTLIRLANLTLSQLNSKPT